MKTSTLKKFTVEWHGKGLFTHIHSYLSKDEQHAYTQAIEEHTYSEHQKMVIFTGMRLFPNKFENPHYAGFEDPEIEKAIQSLAQHHTRSAGSVGWFENVEGSNMSEKQILLAQLAELRIIKRCVVGTVVIAIVIPLIVGGIISG